MHAMDETSFYMISITAARPHARCHFIGRKQRAQNVMDGPLARTQKARAATYPRQQLRACLLFSAPDEREAAGKSVVAGEALSTVSSMCYLLQL